MRRITFALLATTCLAFGSSAAAAADLAPAMPYKAAPAVVMPAIWSGFYAGLNGGGGFGTTSHTVTLGAAIGGATTGDVDTSGGLFGGTFGYNYQMGQWVIGVENDLDWSNISGTVTIAGVSEQSQLNWLDTTRVRLGWLWSDNFLVYGTAGAAFGGVTDTISAAGASLADTQTRFGWTAGVGGEYRFNRALSAKVEYLYVDLGSQNQNLVDSVKFNTNIVRVGLNWRLGDLVH